MAKKTEPQALDCLILGVSPCFCLFRLIFEQYKYATYKNSHSIGHSFDVPASLYKRG